MRPTSIVLIALALTAQLAPRVGFAADASTVERLQYPMLGKISVRPGKGTIAVRAKWTGAEGTMFNPREVTSVVSLTGAGSEGSIQLIPEKWKSLPKGRGFRYKDRKGTAGGIRSILLHLTSKGGTLTLAGHGSRFKGAQAGSTMVTLTIGTARWCAASSGVPDSCPCAEPSTGTWDAIQTAIIARYGCTEAACHGSSPGTGNLDLRPNVAFENLFGVPSTLDPNLLRVKSADRTHSLFWLKLAKATLPTDYATVPGTGMPFTGSAITVDELEAVRLWIQNGAPRTGVVAGTDRLLSTCLPPPDPIKITPPAVPAVADGVEFYAPPWVIKPHNEGGANGENEVCHATYFDFSGQIPPEMIVSKDDPRCRYWGGRCSNDAGRHCTVDDDCGTCSNNATRSCTANTDCAGSAACVKGANTCQSGPDCFYLNRTELTQDPNSHHSIIHIYRGKYDPGTPQYESGFGPFTCRAGANADQPCDPLGSKDQCPGSACAGQVKQTVACFGFGPPDYGFDITGTGSNNAPSVGGSQQPYLDTRYAAGVYGIYPVKGTMIFNSHAFNVTDQPTTNEQYFNVFFAKTDQDRQNILRAIFDSRYIFTQDVPPFEKREYCATFTLPKGSRLTELSSHNHKRGILFRIWTPPIVPCTPCNPQGGGFAACRTPNPACTPEPGPALVTTTTYNDPTQYIFDQPVPLDSDNPNDRTLKYCVVYDNGLRDPAEVKRRSTSPPTPFGTLAPGGPCTDTTVACLDGPHKGELCAGSNATCDSSPGKGDGLCDACPLEGGVTTEDEMDILLGNWYLPGS